MVTKEKRQLTAKKLRKSGEERVKDYFHQRAAKRMRRPPMIDWMGAFISDNADTLWCHPQDEMWEEIELNEKNG